MWVIVVLITLFVLSIFSEAIPDLVKDVYIEGNWKTNPKFWVLVAVGLVFTAICLSLAHAEGLINFF